MHRHSPFRFDDSTYCFRRKNLCAFVAGTLMLTVPEFVVTVATTLLQRTGDARLSAYCGTAPPAGASGQDNCNVPLDKLNWIGTESLVTTRLSISVNNRDGCRVVVLFTSESPIAMLLPPKVKALLSKVAIATSSIVQLTRLLFLVISTLCHANPNDPACVDPP